MLTIFKPVCILLCIGVLFSSCYPLSMYKHSPYAITTAGKSASAGHHAIYRNNVPACAMRQLLKRFPAADNINWRGSTESGWVAGFVTGAAETKMSFNAHGDWYRIYSLYRESPADVRNIVAKTFSDYRITTVYSVVSPADEYHVTFNIVIRNHSNCKVLELYNGNLSVFTDMDDTR